MDVNYLKSIKNFKNKFMSSNSCNQDRCQTMKYRLNRHLKEHHSPTRQSNTLESETQVEKPTKDLVARGTHDDQFTILVPSYIDTRDEEKIKSPMESSTEPEIANCHKYCVSFTNSVQSDFIAADLNSSFYKSKVIEGSSIINSNDQVNSTRTSLINMTPNCHQFEKHNQSSDLKDFFDVVTEKPNSQSSCDSLESTTLHGKESIKTLSLKHKVYKEKVQDVVNEWLPNIPIWPHLDDATKSLREDKINTLIDKIHNMFGEINEGNYEEKLKLEISKCLDNLPIMTVDSENNQVSHKENCNIKLLQEIKKLNERVNEHILCHDSHNNGIDNEKSSTYTRKKLFEKEINNWLEKIELRNDNIRGIVPPEKIIDFILNRLSNLLDEPNNSKIYKLTLKGEIVELLLDLPIHFEYPKNKMVHINKLAEGLANGLLSVLGQFTNHMHDRIRGMVLRKPNKEVLDFKSDKVELKTHFMKVIKNVLTTNGIQSNLEMEKDILDNIIENVNSMRFNNHNDIEEIIYSIIYKYTHITELQGVELAKNILIEINNITENGFLNQNPSMLFVQPRLSGALSIYNTETKFKMFTSTPKKNKKPDKDIPKLNPEQISFMEKLSKIIRDWMNILPIHFDNPEDAIFKDTIISDLAGNLMDAIKYDQILTGLRETDKRFIVRDKESTLKDIIFLWLNRYQIFDNREKCTKEIEDLFSKVNKIPVPVLTRPQHGTRQAVAKTAWLEGENFYNDEYIPKGIDILEDNISMWMNEQSDIFTYIDHSMRGRLVKALAEDIQERLVSKHSDKEIINDIGRWLNEVVKPEEKEHIPDLVEELKNRIKDIPQDITVDRRYMEKMYEIYLKWLAEQNPESNESLTFDEDFLDPNGTIKQYIGKLIQKNYDIEDATARKVFSYTLKKELIKLNPDDRRVVYNNSGQIRNNQIFSAEKLGSELEYIKILSDWLNTLPLDPNYKVLKNKHRIEFIHNLAKYFTEIEDERAKFPNAMDYDAYLMSIIASNTVYLPLPKEQKVCMLQTATSLLKKLEDYRQSALKKYPKQAINTDDLGIFIEEFIKEHGQDVVDDPLKLEVWMDRLTEEVQNIARETADPMLLGKTQIFHKLTKVPFPEEESVALFGLELDYATEITDWLKNLPLKKVFNKSEEQSMVRKISELADRMIDRRIRKMDNSKDTQEDTNIVEFIRKWIFELPLDTQDEIVVPVVIQQLMNRIDKVNKPQGSKKVNDFNRTTEKCEHITEKNTKTKSTSKLKKLCEINPENAITEAVETFCNALPIRANNEDIVKATKDDIAKKLLQKISKLNIDPTICNDELLFQEIFRDEVDLILESMPQKDEHPKLKEKLKNTLIDSVVELESVVKEQSAGGNYKKKLENTIEASIPNPVQMSQMYDPGFEFYKNRLATMFIMENFDHADEDVKLKYEKRIQSEIDKYFEYAQNRNAIPLSRDRIQNELYSALFKVPIPNEASIAGEVEEAKTRFEIDAWYELLPLKPTNNLDELLERDKILATLAKRIHEIERVEKDSTHIIHKEIIKWLSKLPLLSENMDELASQLQKILKSTSKDRKCIYNESLHEKGKGRGKRKPDKSVDKNKLGINDANNEKKQSLPKEKPQLYSQVPVVPLKQAADLILEAVETWCSELPLPTSNPREAASSRSVRDTLAINIILKISELNSDPEVFPDEYEYDVKLDQEIDKLIYNLPLLCDFQSREAKKCKLKEMIRSIKPFISLERDRQEYKEHLEHTVCSLLEKSHKSDQTKKLKPSKDIVERIVDDFIEYNWSKENVEERNVHKISIHNAIVKHLSDIKDDVHKESAVDPLITRNELICEMSKVPPPGEAVLNDIVEEIRVKNEVHDFFQELCFPKENATKTLLRSEMKVKLAKKLFDLERNGHSIANDSNMKKEINKCLTILGKQVSPEVIDKFVIKLQSTEANRKTTNPVQNRKYVHPTIPNLQQTLPSIGRPVGDAHTVLIPKPTVSSQAYSHPPHHDPRYFTNSSLNQSRPTNPANGIRISGTDNLCIVRKQSAASKVPVEVMLPGHQQSSPSMEAVIAQQFTSPIAAVIPSSNNTLPQPPVTLMHTPSPDVSVHENVGSILSVRSTADSNIRDARPTQVSESRAPSRRRRDPESEPCDEIYEGCKCSLRNRARKRKRICMRGRNFPDDFDCCMPSPFIWQPIYYFY